MTFTNSLMIARLLYSTRRCHSSAMTKVMCSASLRFPSLLSPYLCEYVMTLKRAKLFARVSRVYLCSNCSTPVSVCSPFIPHPCLSLCVFSLSKRETRTSSHLCEWSCDLVSILSDCDRKMVNLKHTTGLIICKADSPLSDWEKD